MPIYFQKIPDNNFDADSDFYVKDSERMQQDDGNFMFSRIRYYCIYRSF